MTTYHLPICYCLLSILHCIYIHICLSLYTYMLKTLKVWTVVCPPPSPPLFMQHSHFLKTWKPLPHPPNTIWGRGESSFSPLWVEVTHQLQQSYRNRGCRCLPLPPPPPFREQPRGNEYLRLPIPLHLSKAQKPEVKAEQKSPFFTA